MAAAPICRRFLRRRWLFCGVRSGGLRREAEAAAAAGARGVKDEDLATSGEVVWRWPQFWGGACSGASPGRCCFFGVESSFSELEVVVARQRLRARSFSALWVTDAGDWSLRRPRRRRAGVLGVLEVEDDVLQQRCSLYPLFVDLAACILICSVIFSF